MRRPLGLVTTVATPPPGPKHGHALRYPKPTYLFHGRDRAADCVALLTDMAALLGRSPVDLAAEALAGLATPLPGFACAQCGCCCTTRDAFQGRVSPEEVDAWARLGLTRILRLVGRVDRPGPHGRPGYSFYRAWIDPHTGRAYRSCPWLRTLPDGRSACRIQAHKPLKCRAFPFHADHARRMGCRGLDQGPPPDPAMTPDAVYSPPAPV